MYSNAPMVERLKEFLQELIKANGGTGQQN
jgi:hypothetical protein